jgi:hypothetical protein
MNEMGAQSNAAVENKNKGLQIREGWMREGGIKK